MIHVYALNSKTKAGTASYLLQTCCLWITVKQILAQMFNIQNILQGISNLVTIFLITWRSYI